MPEQNRLVPTPAASDLPTFSLLQNGVAIASTYQVVSVSVHKAVNRIAEAEIILLDGNVATETFEASNREDFIPGKELEIKAGYHHEEETIFKGTIVKHAIQMMPDEASALILTLKHPTFKLALARNNRIFSETKDSEAMETIFSEYGIGVRVEATAVTHESLVHYNAFDWDFVVMRAEINGLVVINENNGVTIKKPAMNGEEALALYYGSSLLEFEAEMDGRTSYPSIKTYSWDASEQELKEEVGSSSLTEEGNLSTTDVADALQIPDLKIKTGSMVAAEEMAQWAHAQAMRKQLSKIKGRAKCIGFAAIQPGDVLALNGVGDRFSGKAFVAGVAHTLAAGKWETDIQFGLDFAGHAQTFDNIAEQAAHGRLPSVHGLQIGVAVDLEDPQNAGRVKVKIPSLLADESVWARVATMDAGKERGSFFLPEIGDELIIGFLSDDPDAPVILGMLNSSKMPPPLTAKNDNHQKGFFTRDKMKFLFDDEKKIICLETPNGNKVVLSQEEKGLTLKDENGNLLQMNDEGILLQSDKKITIKSSGDVVIEGMNLELKASANFKAEGSAGAAVKSSAITELKGSLVNIN